MPSHDRRFPWPASRFERLFVLGVPAISLAGLAAELAGAHGAAPELVSIFSLSYEQNLPTWTATVLLLLCARALADVAARDTEHARGFAVLALLFTFMSLDEAIEIHEHLGALFEGSGPLYFGWVVPATFLLLVFAVFALPFLRSLPRVSAEAFTLAGATYVFGALVLELPLGAWTEQHGSSNLVYGLIDYVEETLELVGASLFLLALRGHEARLCARA